MLKTFMKHSVCLIIFTLIVTLWTAKLQPILMAYIHTEKLISQNLLGFLTGGEMVRVFRKSIAIIFIPLFAGMIPAGIYRLSKQKPYPYFWPIIWGFWLVEVTALIVLY